MKSQKSQNTKEENINNQNNNKIDGVIFDLENKKDLENLEKELKSSAVYFSPEEGISYKIKLLSTKITQIEKDFEKEDGTIDKIIKYVISVNVKGSDKSEFTGLYEIGKSILNPIVKNYEKGAIFNLQKSGTGKKTRYSVTKDF